MLTQTQDLEDNPHGSRNSISEIDRHKHSTNDNEVVRKSLNSLYSCSSFSSHSSNSSNCSLSSTQSSSHTSTACTDLDEKDIEISFYNENSNADNFTGRVWLFFKLFQWLNHKSSNLSSRDFDCSSNGVILVGGPGCGKTALFDEIIKHTKDSKSLNNPTAKLANRILASYKCDRFTEEKVNLPRFILSLKDQISNSKHPISSFYTNYLDKKRSPSLFTTSKLCLAPDQVFRRGILDILNQYRYEDGFTTLVILIDSIDNSFDVQSGFSTCLRDNDVMSESYSSFTEFQSFQNKSLDSNLSSESPREFNNSRNISELISRNINFIPKWLSFIISCNRENRTKLGRQFPRFQRLTLDDLRRPSVLQDIQQYMLKRLETEEILQKRFHSQDGIKALQQINIKSNGCILFVKIVLDGCSQGWISLSDISTIPGTLNGLYLWLCEYLFPVDSKVILLAEVKVIFEIILASNRSVTIQDLHSALRQNNKNYQKKNVESHLHAMGRVLLKDHNKIRFFHNSFGDWIKDLKHCTENYFCNEQTGHELLAKAIIERARMYSFKNEREVFQLAHHINQAGDGFSINPKEIANLIKFSKINLNFKGPKVSYWSLKLDVEAILLKFGHCPIFFNTLKVYKKEIDRERECEEMNNELKTTSISNLCNAVHQGEGDTVRSILKTGVIDVNSCNFNGSTALNLAARRDNLEIVKLLIEYGADVDQIDLEGWSPLRSASWSGNIEIVKHLLNSKANVDLTGNDKRTALRAASWAGHNNVVELLLKNNAEIDKCDAEGRTPLIAAAYMGNVHVLNTLINYNANINHSDNDGRTALNVASVCVAASENHTKIVERLLKSNAQPDIPDNEGITPLLGATYNSEGRYRICQLLLEYGAEINQTDKLGYSPLLIASSQGNYELVRYYLSQNASIEFLDSQSKSALTLAAINSKVKVMLELISYGSDIDHQDQSGSTPLHYCAANGLVLPLRLLIQKGARLDLVDKCGQTPLIVAVYHNRLFASLCLICPEVSLPPALIEESDADVPSTCDNFPSKSTVYMARKSINICSNEGMTPLRAAVLNKNYLLIEILQFYLANPNLQDSYGRTILYLLALEGNVDITKRLLNPSSYLPNELKDKVKRANPILSDDEGRCPLHVAAWQGHLELAKLLVKSGVPIDTRDKEGRTPLHSAAWQGDASMCQLLLELGAQVDAICKQSATALCIAAQENHFNVCRVLLAAGANPYQTDAYERSAIRVAKKAGHGEICQLIESLSQSMLPANVRIQPSLTGLQANIQFKNSNNNLPQPVYDMEYVPFSNESFTSSQTDSRIQFMSSNMRLNLQGKIENSDNTQNYPIQYQPPSNNFYQDAIIVKNQILTSSQISHFGFNNPVDGQGPCNKGPFPANQWLGAEQNFDQSLQPRHQISSFNGGAGANQLDSEYNASSKLSLHSKTSCDTQNHLPQYFGNLNNMFAPINEAVNDSDCFYQNAHLSNVGMQMNNSTSPVLDNAEKAKHKKKSSKRSKDPKSFSSPNNSEKRRDSYTGSHKIIPFDLNYETHL